MKQITSIREGVENLLKIKEITNAPAWEIVKASNGELYDTVLVDGKAYPLFWWRYNSQQAAIRSNAKTIQCVTAKLNLCCDKTEGIDRLMFREFDLAEWFMYSKIKYFNAFIKNSSANILATMENENAVQIELGATLPEGCEDQGKHTVWGKNGMLGDRVVSEKLRQQSLYVFTDSPRPYLYSDNTYDLYGLNRYEVDVATTIYHILIGNVNLQEWQECAKRLTEYVRLAHVSNNEARKINASEVVL